MRIAPGILRDLRNLDESPSAAESTEEFIQRHRERRAQWDNILARIESYDDDFLPTAGDLKSELARLQKIQDHQRRLDRLGRIAVNLSLAAFCALAWIGLLAIFVRIFKSL
jgi:hypothetical protein